jgi:hypothetical protein
MEFKKQSTKSFLLIVISASAEAVIASEARGLVPFIFFSRQM